MPTEASTSASTPKRPSSVVVKRRLATDSEMNSAIGTTCETDWSGSTACTAAIAGFASDIGETVVRRTNVIEGMGFCAQGMKTSVRGLDVEPLLADVGDDARRSRRRVWSWSGNPCLTRFADRQPPLATTCGRSSR